MTSEPFRIVAVDTLPEKLREMFVAQRPSERFRFDCPVGTGMDEIRDLVRGAHALVTRHRVVTRDLIRQAAGSLLLIQVMGRLPDRVDLEAACEAGIPVAIMPHQGAMAVADHTMALILALARRLLPGHRGVVEGRYRERDLAPVRTSEWRFAFNWLGFGDVTELGGKILGLVGFGEIGREVARRAQPFDMRILYHQRHRIPERYEHMLGARRVALEELLRESDFVSLHAPHTEETEGLLSRERLARMKPTAYLINTARGGIVDEAALVQILSEKRIAGAGLDVFTEEPLPVGHPLLGLDNVVLAPHTGGGSGGGQRKHIGQILENIARVADGEPPRHLVET